MQIIRHLFYFPMIFLLFPLTAQGQKKHSEPWPRILAVGDSLTEGYGVSKTNSWPALLERRLKTTYPQVMVINSGTSGATTAFGLRSLRFHFKRKKPDLVIYALGSNDGLRGHQTDKIKLNISKALDFVKDHGSSVILAGLHAPPNYGPQYFEEFSVIFKELSTKYAIPLIPFLLTDVATIPELNLPDGIHPNEKGYEMIAKNIYPFVIKALQSIKEKKASQKTEVAKP